jgi:integrase
LIGEGFIFRGPAGQPLDPDTWHREHLAPLLEAATLRRRGAGLHSLRHTYVSLLIDQGEKARYIADQVGHSSTRLTEDLYAHVFKAAKRDAMLKLESAIPYSNHRAEQAATTETSTNTVE